MTTGIEDQALCNVAGHVEMAVSRQMTKPINLILRNPFACRRPVPFWNSQRV